MPQPLSAVSSWYVPPGARSLTLFRAGALERAPQYRPANRTVAPFGMPTVAELELNVPASASVSTYCIAKSLSARPGPGAVALLAASHVALAFVEPGGHDISVLAAIVMSPLTLRLNALWKVVGSAAEAAAGASAVSTSASRRRRSGRGAGMTPCSTGPA